MKHRHRIIKPTDDFMPMEAELVRILRLAAVAYVGATADDRKMFAEGYLIDALAVEQDDRERAFRLNG